LNIRPACPDDADAVWEIFHAIARRGDTYTFDPGISREEALAWWFGAGTHTFVAESEGQIRGTYLVKANQPGAGSHVANAAFMVAPTASRMGIGRAMGEHALRTARELGFRAMQFNFVVSTNRAAVALWQGLGFAIVGQLPGAFGHPEHGYVDAYVMFRSLTAD